MQQIKMIRFIQYNLWKNMEYLNLIDTTQKTIAI